MSWSSRLESRSVALAARGVIAAACGALAWRTRFVQDDAYISWRYAHNLAHGHGLVWNPGVRVEGYTNFLWTLLSAIPIALHRSVEWWSYAVGVGLFAASLLLADSVMRRLGVHPLAALAATLALGTVPSFAAYATGGLETQLQTVIVLGVARVTLSAAPLDRRRSLALGLLSALGLATRLDTAVLIAPLWVALGARLAREEGRVGLLRLRAAVLVGGALVGAWFAWKLWFYGAVLPNTMRAKLGGTGFDLVPRGARFVRSFVLAYRFWLPIAALAPLFTRERLEPRVAGLLATLAAWLVYVVRIGGDFMEYRLLVPVLPVWIVLAFAGVARLRWRVAASAVLAGSLYVGSWAFAHGHAPQVTGAPETIRSLASHLEDTGEGWAEIGRVLGSAFAGVEPPPSIAVTPAGAIPYFSRLPAVDMLGLNDPEVDRFLTLPTKTSGHRRLASLSLLRARRVTFLLAHPVLKNRTRAPPEARYTLRGFSHGRRFVFPDEYTLRGADVVEVPLSYGYVMLMVYLTPSAAIDARLATLGWRRYPLR